MENHPDFLDSSIYSIIPPMEFEYFYYPSSQRYVLVLDRSSSVKIHLKYLSKSRRLMDGLSRANAGT